METYSVSHRALRFQSRLRRNVASLPNWYNTAVGRVEAYLKHGLQKHQAHVAAFRVVHRAPFAPNPVPTRLGGAEYVSHYDKARTP